MDGQSGVPVLCFYVLGDQRMCMTVVVANKQTQDVHTGGAILFVSGDNRGSLVLKWGDGDEWCLWQLQWFTKPQRAGRWLMFPIFVELPHRDFPHRPTRASFSLIWGDNSKVCWFESHSISAPLRLLQQTRLFEINQTSCCSSELLSHHLMWYRGIDADQKSAENKMILEVKRKTFRKQNMITCVISACTLQRFTPRCSSIWLYLVDLQ